MTKRFFGSITELSGDAEFTSHFAFTATDETLEGVVQNIDRTFRDDNEVEREDMKYREITEAEFDVLRRFLPVL